MSVHLHGCVLYGCLKAVVKQRQAADELTRLQDALTKVVNEAGARTRQEVPTHSTCLLTYLRTDCV